MSAGGVKGMDTEVTGGTTVVSGGPGKTPIYVIIVGVFITIILQIVDVSQVVEMSSNDDAGGLGSTTFSHGDTSAREDTFVIGVDGEWPPYCHGELVDIVEEDGSVSGKQMVGTGFLKEVAAAACERGELNCKFPLYGKWTECFDQNGSVGQSLLTDHYDMCLCWTVTPGRLATTIWPTNKERGWTKPAEGGLLVKKAYSDDPSLKMGDSDTSVWNWLAMDWSDGCDGYLMSKKVDDDGNVVTTSDGRAVWEQKDLDQDTVKDCPQGKIRIGYIGGWALKPESFNWVTLANGETPDYSRVEWFDEHIDDTDTKTAMLDYAHIAAALSSDQIDAAYTYTNVIAAHQNTDCTICTDKAIWRKLTFKHTGLFFAAGGASGFFKYGQEAKRDRLQLAVDEFIAIKDEYCPLCNKYWPDIDECKSHCIGCDDQCRTRQPDGR